MSMSARLIKKPSIVGRKNPRWKGGIIVTTGGRVMIYSPYHPNPSKGRYVYRYRLKLEKRLKRFLLPTEVVHHKDGDPTNDRISNLQILSASEHSQIPKMKKNGWSRDFPWCVECLSGVKPHKGRGLCVECYESKRERK